LRKLQKKYFELDVCVASPMKKLEIAKHMKNCRLLLSLSVEKMCCSRKSKIKLNNRGI